ncbi:uncharacterized protein LOC128200825 [Galleria mellonella]|uniref:Uncharacterized protein LOC128200825 n=1 Tax=Galleria mellonella TaxID=7137 RepID=A0ABM3MK10_GALME|nr:uncharacterized protein LOC128200825 [Galleria mellonella]
MSCKCSGVRYEKCKCGSLGPGYPIAHSGGGTFVLLAKDSACYMRPTTSSKRSLLTRFVENLYDKCAGYNLRYCPFRGYVHDNSLRHTMRDVLTLLCFILANLVVLLTILARTTVHISYVIAGSVQWIRRYKGH